MNKKEAMKMLREGKLLLVTRSPSTSNRYVRSVQIVDGVGQFTSSETLHGLTLRALHREVKPFRSFVNGREVSPDFIPMFEDSIEVYYG